MMTSKLKKKAVLKKMTKKMAEGMHKMPGGMMKNSEMVMPTKAKSK